MQSFTILESKILPKTFSKLWKLKGILEQEVQDKITQVQRKLLYTIMFC
jgi:hypothetical protein